MHGFAACGGYEPPVRGGVGARANPAPKSGGSGGGGAEPAAFAPSSGYYRGIVAALWKEAVPVSAALSVAVTDAEEEAGHDPTLCLPMTRDDAHAAIAFVDRFSMFDDDGSLHHG